MYPHCSLKHCIHGDYTHTHTGSEMPNYLLENTGTQEAPDRYKEPTQGSLIQLQAHSETKGISCLCLNPLALDTFRLPPYIDLLRTDLSSINEALGPVLALGMLRAAQYIAHVGNGERMTK